MPLPEALAALLAAQPKFDPSLERKEFTDNRELWRLYLDLYELDATKLKALVLRHSADEPDAKYAKRQALAAVYNLVPMIVNLAKGYLFSESPAYDVNGDPDLEAFLKNCDGNGRDFEGFTKNSALPLAQVLGWVDVLVENPQLPAGRAPLTRADEAAAKLTPYVMPVTPLQRIHWSAQPNHSYNWLRFRDAGNEKTDPFAGDVTPAEAYVTHGVLDVTRPGAEPGAAAEPTAYWIRSWRKPVAPAPAAGGQEPGPQWEHDGGFAPVDRVPVSTLYHQVSNDPDRRHFGLSKVAMMAVLTRQIVQVLSWTAEDVLANLALYCVPSKDGLPLKDEEGNPVNLQWGANTIMWFKFDAQHVPFVLQGDVSHIEIKFKLVELHLREILRIANLLQATGTAGSASGSSAGGEATSGVQAEIERNELFRELTETSQALDTFALQVLALVKSWKTNKPWSVEQLQEEGKVTVRHYKGPWTMDPVDKVIATANEALALFREISPTAVENAMAQAARSLLHNNGDAMKDALKEIAKNTGAVVEDMNDRQNKIDQAAADAAAAEASAAAGEGGGGED
ncbi:MAG TPA: hypothetical protein VK324_06695 [Tepidisphaeraceae bacterium]|nr:hypothetical protein [Tepidisphaeraceae bacterium]